MSRILEYQHSDEQAVVARVLLDLHQALDQEFPGTPGGSRQFTKTVLSGQVEQAPSGLFSSDSSQNNLAQSKSGTSKGFETAAQSAKFQTPQSGPMNSESSPSRNRLEFSNHGSVVKNLSATALEEVWWSRWLTKGLILSFWLVLFYWSGSICLARSNGSQKTLSFCHNPFTGLILQLKHAL